MRAEAIVVAGLLLIVAAGASAASVAGGLEAAEAEASPGSSLLASSPVVGAWAERAVFTFDLEVADGVLERDYWASAAVDLPVTPDVDVRYQEDRATRTKATIPLRDATVLPTAIRPKAVLLAYPGAGDAALRGASDGALALSGAPATIVRSHDVVASTDTPMPYVAAISVDAAHVNATVEGGSLVLAGAFEIYLFEIDVSVASASGAATYRSGFLTEHDGGAARTERVEKLVLRLADARLQLDALGPVEVRALRAEVESDRLALDAARGSLSSADAGWRTDGESVALDGAAAYALAPIDRRSAVLATGALPLAVAVDGDVTPIGFALTRKAAPLPVDAATAGAVAGGGLLLLGIAGAVAWRRRAAAVPAEGLVEEAVLRLEAGDVSGALALFNEAVARDPRNPTLHLDRAQCLERLGRRAEARRAFEVAVRYAPENGEAHYHLARSLAVTGLAPSAIAHLSRAFSLDPAFAAAAREDPAFRSLADHPSYQDLDMYYRRAA